MYPLKGSNAYGQQSYSSQQGYSHPSGGGYSGSQIGASDGGSQHTLVSRQSGMLSSSQEADVGGYRVQSSQAPHYGGAYASVYGSSTLSSAQQMPGISGKGNGSSSLQGRTTYASTYSDPSKFGSGAPSGSLGMSTEDYMASGYGHKADQYSMERRHYGDHQGAYMGREDPSVISLQSQKSETRDQYDQASLFRQQQKMKAQSLQPGPDTRQADFLAARAATIHHGHQDISSYGGRMDAEPHNMSILGSAPYAGQHPTSNLGGPSRGNVDHVYPHGSSGAGYRVGLPPGRDYAAGKGLHGASHESNYQGSMLSQGGYSSVGAPFLDEQKDDRSVYQRELELREERRRELLREREKERERVLEREREREREKDRERLRERERERLKERERERERERQRQRERERERERLLKQRDKERERERKRGPEHRQERSPPRTSKDRQVSSATRDERPFRGSPRRDISHRRHSPVKEKRREYICKVSPFCFVDAVRDYMSLTKRYPRLSISPEFSKVVFNWAKEKLNISLYTPVSFQHEFEVDAEQKDLKHNVVETQKSKSDSTVWNAKVILMSGISVEALEELNAEQNSDDRISHINNLLKFAILRKDHSFTAIGGPWNATLDGGDPSTDNTSLVQTAKRYLKDLTQLDLGNCQHWNEFIKIHYDRIGKDGLLSHKEITVLYLPDLSNCLPSIDQWRSQWLAHKMMVAEKEQFAEKQKKLSEKDLSQGDRKHEISEVAVDVGNDIKVKVEDGRGKHDLESPDCATASDVEKAVDMDTGGMSTADDRQSIKEGEVESIKETTSDMENTEDGASAPAIVDTRKNADKMGETDDENKQGHLEGAVKRDETSLSVTNVRTFVRKKVTKKIPEKTPEKEDQILETFNVQTEKMAEMEPEVLKADVKDEQEGASGKEAVPKTTGKKKVIRKVIKKKIIKLDEKREIAGSKQDGKADPGGAIETHDMKIEVEATVDSGINKSGVRGGNECKELGIVKQDDCGATDGKENKEDKEDEKKTIPDDQGTVETHVAKQEDLKKHGENDRREKDKDEKKSDSKQKSGKESNEKKPEVAPGNPGLFVRTKQTTESKIRSISLSLDGLLDYNEKDTEESTVELSLFAESLNEMIQFEMGSRLLSFLQKLRSNCLAKRNKQKREREETAEKNEKESSAHKRLKSVDDNKVENEWAQSMAQSSSTLDNASQIAKDENLAHGLDESTAENKEEQVMEVQEDLKEAEEMDETPPENVAAKQEEIPGEKVEPEEKADGLPEQEAKGEDGKSREEGTARHDTERGTAREDDPGKKEHAPEVVNGDLLQAFRYFDRNRVGYIKVEDLRLIIHNLGLFLSQKEVKELVQSALLESSSSRDNRVMYHKLVRMGDLLS